MSAGDNPATPKPWENEDIDPVLPSLLGVDENSLPDDVFERILADAMDPANELADESLIPSQDDPALTEDGDFVYPNDAELFLAADYLDDDDAEEPEEIELPEEDDNSHAHHGDGFFGGDDFGADGSGESFGEYGDSHEDDFGGEWS